MELKELKTLLPKVEFNILVDELTAINILKHKDTKKQSSFLAE